MDQTPPRKFWGPMLLLLSTLAGHAAIAAPPCTPAAAREAPRPLHLASPDWRDQVIYFVTTVRFDDGALGNNDQGAGE